MMWKERLNPRGTGTGRTFSWAAGPAFLHSRAGARWIVAFVATTIVFFFFVWRYHDDAYARLLGGTPTIGGGSGVGSGMVGGGATNAVPAQSTRLPAWIDTPPAFDVSQIPGGYKAPIGQSSSSVAITEGLPRVLAEAAERFLARPALSHEQARAQNEAGCPRDQLDRQVNADQLRDGREGWLAVGAERVMEMRRDAVRFLVARGAEEEEEAGGAAERALLGPGWGVEKGTRGVVIAAGNKRTVERAAVCVRELQRLGWKGPVEVWHFEGELEDEKDRQTLRALGVGIHVVSAKKTPGQWKNFELKAEAILRSSFDEVLYLDSDNFPLSDVTALFEAPLFTDPRGGRAVFWPDLNRDHPDNAIHRVLGVPCHDAWELDSGQVLIAKSANDGLNLAALWLARYMQTEGDYWFSGGDKDTFRYAFLALGIPYTPAPRWLAVLGSLVPARRGAGDQEKPPAPLFCGAAMLQYGIAPPRPGHADPSDPTHPEPLFVHANLLKHMSGARRGESFTQTRRLSLGQDDVRARYYYVQGAKEKVGADGGGGGAATTTDGSDLVMVPVSGPLDAVAGGAREVRGRGLCSDIWAFAEGAEVETVGAKETFGELMAGFEDAYFAGGAKAGAWR